MCFKLARRKGWGWGPFAALAATSYNSLPRAAHKPQQFGSEVGARSAEAEVGPEFCGCCEKLRRALAS